MDLSCAPEADSIGVFTWPVIGAIGHVDFVFRGTPAPTSDDFIPIASGAIHRLGELGLFVEVVAVIVLYPLPHIPGHVIGSIGAATA